MLSFFCLDTKETKGQDWNTTSKKLKQLLNYLNSLALKQQIILNGVALIFLNSYVFLGRRDLDWRFVLIWVLNDVLNLKTYNN